MQTPKARALGKGKRTRADDIPPKMPSNMVEEVNILRELQECYQCAAHSKPGMKTFCWIEMAGDGVKGGHRELTHREMTLWAQYIVSQTSRCDEGKKNLPCDSET